MNAERSKRFNQKLGIAFELGGNVLCRLMLYLFKQINVGQLVFLNGAVHFLLADRKLLSLLFLRRFFLACFLDNFVKRF